MTRKKNEVIAADGGGLRFADGKLRIDLMPIEWERALAQILTRALKKYPERNWERGMKWSYCYASLRRHLWAFLLGERYDKETGCHHMAHLAWNALALMSYDLRGIGENDLPLIQMEESTTDDQPTS